jgi:hypothetical protein
MSDWPIIYHSSSYHSSNIFKKSTVGLYELVSFFIAPKLHQVVPLRFIFCKKNQKERLEGLTTGWKVLLSC